MRVLALAFVFSVLALAIAGCGVRTPLEVGPDGSAPAPRDAGSIDGGRRDGGATCRTSADCDDGDECNGVEQCAAGRCQPGSALDCSDGIECTRDACLPGAGCQHQPDDALCGPAMRCDASMGCVARRCVGDVDCDDGLACNGPEFCGTDGLCRSAGIPVFCDDGIDCTRDFCQEPGLCRSEPDSSRCPVGRCVPGVGCAGGSCSSRIDCDDGLVCNGLEDCVAGECRPGIPFDCDDGIPCTDDVCSEFEGGCRSTPNSMRCPPGQWCEPPLGCAIPPRCRADAECDDGFLCNGAERCVSGSCRAGTPLVCDDMQDCSVDYCVEGLGCISEPRSPRDVCGNGVDDDCDFLVDCSDSDCAGTPGCPGCLPEVDHEFDCLDGRDDDCDMLVDCDDPDCAFFPDCCRPRSRTEIDCFDGTDDDCDAFFDCDDPDCARACPRPEICDNFVDDDRDGFVDCADVDCRLALRCRDAGPPVDAGVFDAGVRIDAGPVRAELGIAACTNGIDDDGDGRRDCNDPDCRPFGPASECCNGIDDPDPGMTPEDVFTCRCFDDSTCVGVSVFDQVCWTRSFNVCAPRCNFYGGDSFCRMWFPGSMERCDRTSGQCVP